MCPTIEEDGFFIGGCGAGAGAGAGGDWGFVGRRGHV